MENFSKHLKTFLAGLVIFAGALVVSAQATTWTGPRAAAPGQNTPAPLNVGVVDQSKAAGLALNRLLVNGQVRIDDGTAAVGKVLTSLDDQGTAEWAAVGASGSAGLEYKTNTTSTGVPSSNIKEVTATCSVGKRVVNGGCVATGPYLIITGSLPTSDGSGWFCRADTFSVYYGPNAGGIQYGLVKTLTARAICQ